MKPTTLMVVVAVGLLSLCTHREGRRIVKRFSWGDITDIGQTFADSLQDGFDKAKDGAEDLADDVGTVFDKGLDDLEYLGDEFADSAQNLAEQFKETFDELKDANEDILTEVEHKLEENLKKFGKFAHDAVYKTAKEEFEMAKKRFEEFIEEASEINDFDDVVELLKPLVIEVVEHGACHGVCFGARVTLFGSAAGLLTKNAIMAVCKPLCTFIVEELEDEILNDN